ncbi:MAG TPA: hypothetical protein PKM57_10180 [Kiritimatiellia bacterium]|nr:hypothetical protein [Kiritimatiellia bacterium]HPS07183.1 hypothetical protein [Kiritimatiellia bacterium]
MKTKRAGGVTIFGAVAFSLSLRLTAAAEAAPFRNGDRACFIGDSISHQMLYHTEITLLYLTRFP